MALTTFYATGTASVSNGATAITFAGAILGTDAQPNIMPGDLFLDPAQPLVPPQRIASVDYDAGTAALAVNWPGTTMSAAAYEVRFVGIVERSTAQTRRLLEELSTVQANGRGLFLRFDDGTTDADPGAGNIRLNNATIGSATAAYVDNLDANGATISAILDTWDDAGSTDGRGQLWLRSIADPSIFRAYNVTGSVVDGTGYRKLTLAHVGGSGALVGGDEVMVSFLPLGQGATGQSAYELAVAEGFVGDEAAWLASLDGIDGDDGIDGASALTVVRAVATSNITISTALNDGDSIDGVTLATNDLVLVAGQSTSADNGVYVVGASPARDTSFDTYDEHPGRYFSAMEGTANADTLWRCTSNKGGTLGSTALTFEEFTGGTLVPFTAASTSGPASIKFAEDTDNGSHEITLQAPASLTANRTITLPDGEGTVALTTNARPVDFILQDQQTSGTHGGGLTSGSDQIRRLNTEVYDPDGLVSLSSDQFTLPAGTYFIEWYAMTHVVTNQQSFLYNVTDSAVVLRSQSGYTSAGEPNNVPSAGSGVFTIAGTKTFEIRHRVGLTVAVWGGGFAASHGTEIYVHVQGKKFS